VTTAGAMVPSEPREDVLVLDEPLPTAEALEGIVDQIFVDSKLPKPKKEVMDKAVDALVGLAAFPAEQRTTMCLSRNGLDLNDLWDSKRQAIEQVRVVSVWRGSESRLLTELPYTQSHVYLNFRNVKNRSLTVIWLTGIVQEKWIRYASIIAAGKAWGAGFADSTQGLDSASVGMAVSDKTSEANPSKQERGVASQPNPSTVGFEFFHCRVCHCNRTGDRECLSGTSSWRDYLWKCERQLRTRNCRSAHLC
jgi:hypothetical protein